MGNWENSPGYKGWAKRLKPRNPDSIQIRSSDPEFQDMLNGLDKLRATKGFFNEASYSSGYVFSANLKDYRDASLSKKTVPLDYDAAPSQER